MYDENLDEGWEEIDTVDEVTHRIRFGSDVVIWMDKELDVDSEFDSFRLNDWAMDVHMNDGPNELDLSYYEQTIICTILFRLASKFDTPSADRVFSINIHDKEYAVLELD